MRDSRFIVVPTMRTSKRRIGCHTFRATGITGYLTNGGKLEIARRMAGHSNAITTGFCGRPSDDIIVSEVERVGI